jgi:hypothetical protein
LSQSPEPRFVERNGGHEKRHLAISEAVRARLGYCGRDRLAIDHCRHARLTFHLVTAPPAITGALYRLHLRDHKEWQVRVPGATEREWMRVCAGGDRHVRSDRRPRAALVMLGTDEEV